MSRTIATLSARTVAAEKSRDHTGLIAPDQVSIRPESVSPIEAAIHLVSANLALCWVTDPGSPERRFVVDILADGQSLGYYKAETFVSQLYDRGFGDGCYGVYLALDTEQQIDLLELKLCNDDLVLAALTPGAISGQSGAFSLDPGSVSWRGGLRLSGSVRSHGLELGSTPEIRIFEGAQALRCETTFAPGVDSDTCSRQFDVRLPASVADGETHSIRVVTSDGELRGSPVSVLSHRSGFQALLDQALQRRSKGGTVQAATLAMLDHLLPSSLPFGAYTQWDELAPAHPVLTGGTEHQRVGIIVIGRPALEATLASLRAQIGDLDLKVAVVETDQQTARFQIEAWREACSSLASLDPALYCVVRGGTSLRPHACLALSQAMSGDGATARIVMADHELFDHDGTVTPLFAPAFDEERLIAQGYAEGIFGFRQPPDLWGQPGEGISSYDVLLGAVATAVAAPEHVVHVPHVVASVPKLAPEIATTLLVSAASHYLAAKGISAEVSAGEGVLLPAAQVRRMPPEGEVTIIIPTRDRLDLLKPCIDSIRHRTAHSNYRIVIIDNGSRDPETLDYLRKIGGEGVSVSRDDKIFNYSRLNNDAVARVSSPFICFLNNDVEVVSPLWLHAMQGYFARPDVGGVGAKLVWPNGMLQHGGVVLGLNFAAGHAYDRYLASEPGYADGIITARECSAVTAACMMVRKADFETVGGFDEQAFPVAFNDVDLCLKLRRHGRVLIWTPQAELLHHESASRRGDWEQASKRSRADKELSELRSRWVQELVDDPYYNPNLNLDAYAFTGLALPPRSRSPRQRQT